MNCDICFVVPALQPKLKEESIGTLILAKKVIVEGFKAQIVRYWESKISPKNDYNSFKYNIINCIISKQPKVVSFYCRCEEYHICIDLAKEIKGKDETITILFGGPQAELVAKETIKKFSWVDYVLCSEGENTIVPILNFLIRNKAGKIQAKDIPGLTYRDKRGDVLQNNFPELLCDQYVREYQYYDLIESSILEKAKSVQIDVGRGCPFACTFCSTKTFWKRKFRLRSVDNILDEIEYVINTYGITDFDFKHDLFTANKRRVLEFCRALRKRKLSISWGCDSRLDTIDKNLIDIMCECGMNRIFFGVETGSERMQKLINKNLKLKSGVEVISHCITKGLHVTASFIYGFPEETEEDLSQTLKMIIELHNNGCNILTNMCHIMNGTDLYNRYGKSLVITENISYNKSIIAFEELYGLISSNRDIFPNFYDYPTELRKSMTYLDIYRFALLYCKIHMPEVHLFLQAHNYGSLDMYKMFCNANSDIITEGDIPSNGDPNKMISKMKRLPDLVYNQLIKNLVTLINGK